MHPLLISNILFEVFRHLPFCETFRFRTMCKAWKEAFFKYLPNLLPETFLQVLYEHDRLRLYAPRVEKVYKLRFLEQKNPWSVFILHPDEDQAGITVDQVCLQGFRIFSEYLPYSKDPYVPSCNWRDGMLQEDRGPSIDIDCNKLWIELPAVIEVENQNIGISATVCNYRLAESSSSEEDSEPGEASNSEDDDTSSLERGSTSGSDQDGAIVAFGDLIVRVDLSAWGFELHSQCCKCVLEEKRKKLQKEIFHNGWIKCSSQVWNDFLWNPRAKHQWKQVMLKAKWSHEHACKLEWVQLLMKRHCIKEYPPEEFPMLVSSLSYQKLVDGDKSQEISCLQQLLGSEKRVQKRYAREKELLSRIQALIKKRFLPASPERLKWEIVFECKECPQEMLPRKQREIWNNYIVNGGNLNDVVETIFGFLSFS